VKTRTIRSNDNPTPSGDGRIRPRLALAVATIGGVGDAPFAPGTFGSAVGLLVWWLLGPSAIVQAMAIAAIFGAGVWSAGVCERHCGRTDPGHVVIDEVVGMLITLFLIPVGWAGMFGAFLLFRLADVIKPYPANRFERLHGGLGVMADDCMAGVYANLALRILLALGNRVIW
jgi:phosphatidylglycerophosphatase A